MTNDDFPEFFCRVLIITENLRQMVGENSTRLIETNFVFPQVAFRFSIVPFKPDTHRESFRVNLTPGGSRRACGLSLQLRNGADVALLMPNGNTMVAHLVFARAPGREVREPNISGQVF